MGHGIGQRMPPFADLSELIEARMVEYGVPGVACGVCKDGTTTTATHDRGFTELIVEANPHSLPGSEAGCRPQI